MPLWGENLRGSTFSENVKEELSKVTISNENEAKLELTGFLKARGGYDIKKERFVITLSNLSAARRFISLLEYLTGKRSEEISIGVRNLDSRKRVVIAVHKEDVSLSWKDYMNNEFLSKFVGNDPISFSAFLRGSFLAAGSIANPRKHYHFEIVTFDQLFLEEIKKKIEKFLGIRGNVVKLRYSFRLYYKCSKCILELLHLMGAKNAALEFERVMNEKAAKGDTNRSFNFISANAVRSGTSIAKQIKAIRKIEKTIGLENLPEDLRKVAIARLENEDLSLRELGEILNMSKMMVYGRLKKLLRIAGEID